MTMKIPDEIESIKRWKPKRDHAENSRIRKMCEMNENGSEYKRTEAKRLLSDNENSQPAHGNDGGHNSYKKTTNPHGKTLILY